MYGTGSPFGLSDPVFDSVGSLSVAPQSDQVYQIPDLILDAAADDLGEKQVRANAIAAVLAWLEGADFSYAALESIIAGLADIDDDGEITEPEEELFNELLVMTADALVELGGNTENVKTFIDDESEKAGEKLAVHLTEKLDDTDKSDDEIVSEYAVKAKLILDATQKVVRGGKSH